MILISPLLLAISLNIDTLSTSTSYGIKKILLPKPSIILLTVLTCAFTFLSLYIGELCLPLFGLKLGKIFGAVLLGYIGVSLIVQYIKLKEERNGFNISYFYGSPLNFKNIIDNPIIADADNSNHIDIKECMNLSLAIAINNFITAFAASISSVNMNFSIFFYFVISLLSIYLGYYNFHLRIIKIIKKYSYLISGIILIILCIFQMFI